MVAKLVLGASFALALLSLLSSCASLGAKPTGDRLARIAASPNYRDGQFRNREEVPPPSGGLPGILKGALFDNSPRNRPKSALPSRKTDLSSLPRDRDALVWLGHSSYFLVLGGKRFLVDPALNGDSRILTAFPGSRVYGPEDIPEIDYLVITHDHYDHLDYKTALALRDRVSLVLTGLGTGAHLERWGYSPERIVEFDWDEGRVFPDGVSVAATTARHFSGRTTARNRALWVSFVVSSGGRKVFLGGDSGYGAHFAEIGAVHGPFDLVLLECGQYNERWRWSHLFPEETARAAADLGARYLLAGHWGKYSLSLHAWDEPIRRLLPAAASLGVPVLHPMVGEPVLLDGPGSFGAWWEGVE